MSEPLPPEDHEKPLQPGTNPEDGHGPYAESQEEQDAAWDEAEKGRRVRTTQQVREAWAPACKANRVATFAAYRALDAVMRRHGYRPRSGVTGAFNCRKITGGSNYSLHAYDPGERFVFWTGVAVTTAVAVDVNWDKNPYGPRLVTDMPRAMVDEICAIRTVDGLQVWRWGGYYTKNKDAMHFEVVVSPAELARGIRGQGQEDEVTDADLKKISDMIDAKLDERIGKPYAKDLTVLAILTELVDGKYLDGVKLIRAEIKALSDKVGP